MKTAVIYTRVSSTTDRQNTERQVYDLQQYAQAMQYNVQKEFSEKISGAKKNTERAVLQECLEYCQQNNIDMLLISEMSRLGRNILEIQESIKFLADNTINLYMQKERLTLLDETTKELSMFAPIMIATLATCAAIERDNITFRLNSGRERYKANGGTLGRPKETKKSPQQIAIDHSDIIKLLNSKKNYSIREIAKLTGKGISTVQRVKNNILKL